ncbi:hypothetical protein [Peribacillus deserti]|uniref:hypothetical protein n=1 Tax=Peribacillus deserti TaxID=673318 RepID=UPI0015E096FA|nr:hypothetical protein [Peribacillus deserti]
MKKIQIERLKTIKSTKVINNGHITTSTGQKIGYATIKRIKPVKKAGRLTNG